MPTSVLTSVLLCLFSGATFADEKHTVAVTGNAEETVKPDMMMVTVYVTGEGLLMADAAKNASERVQSIIDAVKKVQADIKPPEVFTLSAGQKETRSWSSDQRDDPKPALIHRITFTLPASASSANEIIDAAIRAGASLWLQRNTYMSGEINSNIVYGLTDEEGALAKVRRSALQNARQRGEELAALAGKTLGNIVSVPGSMSCGLPFDGPYFTGTRHRYPRKFIGTDPERLEIRDSIQVTFEWHDRK